VAGFDLRAARFRRVRVGIGREEKRRSGDDYEEGGRRRYRRAT
jgi:hypothetical protein